ncbi:ABC transporter substrate-binding protein [Gymnodinialimonas sp. 2305UL16-5]|uniref:ABC transporter substrate-binding protein n=1 Tax=Gymnodinialimonas mytili TaxID=3126503 RepID=UPI00309D4726
MTAKTLLGAAAALTALTAGAQAEPIRIAINEWTGQHISAHIAGALFEELGHEIEFVTAGAVPQIAAMMEGGIHFQPEFWTNNTGDFYDDAVASGDILVIGDLGLEPQEGWIYPPYMEELCPGLPSYEALYDCAQAFAAADTFPNGRLITYPADWGTRSSDLVELLDLPFRPVPGGSEGAMLAELQGALAAEQPLLMMMWQPHWVFAEVEMNWVEWDSAHGECDEADQTRGEACGFQQASVAKIASASFQSDFADAYALADLMNLTNDVQNALILEVDQNGRDVEEVVAEWMEANADTWQPWVTAVQ